MADPFDVREYALPDDTIPPDVDALRLDDAVMTEDQFPLTQLEAWMIMRGYWVKPKRPVNVNQLLKLPGSLEMTGGYIGMRR